MAKSVKCPKCGKLVEYSTTNPFRPFCSERCQLIDLGQWADEKYAVPVEESDSVKKEKDSEDSEDEADRK